MYYSYYFDIEKKHRINFGLQALVTNEESGTGTINAQFNAYIREVKDGQIVKEESQNVQFMFDGNKRDNEDASDYDVDFLRERFSETSKFIFKVINNRNEAQNVTLGVITETAKKNPLGCEIIYEEEPYKADLKAGNLSKLESKYVEPLVRQTVAQYTFNEGGTPEEIQLPDGGEYVNGYKLYRTSRLSTELKEKIQGNNKFVFEMNIAPERFDVEVEPTIFEVKLNGIGTFALNKTTIQYIAEGSSYENRATAPLVNPLTAEYLFNSGLRSSSLLQMIGDGQGNIKIRYAGVEINSTYNVDNQFNAVSFEGMLVKGTAERIISKIDNILAYYEK